jgi:hypothetical protein
VILSVQLWHVDAVVHVAFAAASPFVFLSLASPFHSFLAGASSPAAYCIVSENEE